MKKLLLSSILICFALIGNVIAQSVANQTVLPASYRMAMGYDSEVYENEQYIVLEDGSIGVYGALYKNDGVDITEITLPGSLRMAQDHDMEVYGSELYTVLEDGFSGIRGALHKYDGTTFTQINLPGSLTMARDYDMEVYNNDLYLVLEDGSSGIYGALYKYDGTSFTQIVLPGSLRMAESYNMIMYDNDLYVVLEDGFSGIRGALHKYDGTTFTQINLPGSLEMARDYEQEVYNNDLYLVLEDGFSGIRGALHKYDGTTFTQINLPGSLTMARDYDLEVYNNNLNLVLEDGSSGIRGALHKYDGTSLTQINLPGSLEMARDYDMEVFNCKLYFVLEDGSSGVYGALYELDNVLPSVITQNITVELDANGEASATAVEVDNGSTDNCGVDTLALDVTSFDCSNIGENTVTLTVTDASGNQASATAVVTVVDILSPAVVTQDITVELDTNGETSITADQIDNGTSDNCSSISGYCIEGMTYGNAEILIEGAGMGRVDFSAGLVSASSGGVPMELVPITTIDSKVRSGDLVHARSTLSTGSRPSGESIFFRTSDGRITWGGHSPSGPFANRTRLIIEQENVAAGELIDFSKPYNLRFQLNGRYLSQAGSFFSSTSTPAEVSAILVSGDLGATNNCLLTTSLDATTFDCSNLGEKTVTLTVTDGSGNSSSATAIVTVIDNIAPTIVLQDVSVELDAEGTVSIEASAFDNGSFDNCGEVTFSTNLVEILSCGALGLNEVTVTVTDASGNQSQNTAILTVLDNLSPAMVTQDLTVELNANGEATITAAQVDNGSADNCGVDTLALDITTFDCSNLGENTVTLTATDASGNQATATATVTVVDNSLPTAVAQNLTVDLDEFGAASITAAQVDNGSSDKCGIDNLSLDVNSFDCSALGENTVTLTATDGSGNQATATAVITVIDAMAPALVTADITVSLDDNATVSIEPGDLVDTLEDNCSLAGEITLALDQDTFTATGVYVVNITATDASGNTTTESAEVTVDSTLSIDQVDSDIQVKLYPNPTTDHLFFEVSNTELMHITIYDMNGKLVKTSQESHSVDVTNLSSGVYFAKVDAKGGNTLKILRFIKK
ncbi:T9SS type A sorting domain-containing protein [Psychroflexus salinarum]|uniref:T9SS type A sorting domain-containing protein n=1 Tax=Psychroflexus salinarum TaxID=546024 RepID=A0ABW3GQT5_9FLAO